MNYTSQVSVQAMGLLSSSGPSPNVQGGVPLSCAASDHFGPLPEFLASSPKAPNSEDFSNSSPHILDPSVPTPDLSGALAGLVQRPSPFGVAAQQLEQLREYQPPDTQHSRQVE